MNDIEIEAQLAKLRKQSKALSLEIGTLKRAGGDTLPGCT